jgi:hypothetical protein
MADYLPYEAGELLTWAENFASRIAADPAGHGLKASDAAAITAAVGAYAQAYALAFAPATRTKSAVHGKDQARIAMLKVIRPYAQLIKASPAVAGSAKVNLGLTRPRAGAGGRRRIGTPEGRPYINIVGVQPLRHVLHFTNAGKGEDGVSDRLARPQDAVGLQLFCHVGSDEPKDPLDARFVRFVSRSRHTVEFKPEQKGLTAFYFARWQTATGETGPWSIVASMTVAG